ncbi:hypothetical protein Hdeb2414_s0226g00839941 [Helianthus debilis subsp. tardiflorus]
MNSEGLGLPIDTELRALIFLNHGYGMECSVSFKSQLISFTPGYKANSKVGSGHGSKRVRVNTGQLKRVVLVRVKAGSGWNGFGSERFSGRVGKFFFHNTTIMFCSYSSAKYQMIQ